MCDQYFFTATYFVTPVNCTKAKNPENKILCLFNHYHQMKTRLWHCVNMINVMGNTINQWCNHSHKNVISQHLFNQSVSSQRHTRPKSCSYHVTLLPSILKIHVTVSRESRYRLSVQNFTCWFHIETLCLQNDSLAGIILCDL